MADQQAAYAFWTCSTLLPLYLTPSIDDDRSLRFQGNTDYSRETESLGVNPGPEERDEGKSSGRRHLAVPLNGCGSICREVERKCPFFIKGLEEDKAAGNPSFICKDEAIPNVIINPMGDEAAATLPLCCYKAVDDPPPGAWLSIDAEDPSRPYCIEPDSIRAKRSKKGYSSVSETQSKPAREGDGVGGPALTTLLGSDQPSSDPSLDYSPASYFDDPDPEESVFLLSGRDDEMRCDIIFSPPSSSLNITSVALDEWEAWHHTLSNTSIFGGTDVYFDDEDEGDLLFASLARWWSKAMNNVGLSGLATSGGTQISGPHSLLVVTLHALAGGQMGLRTA